MIAVFAKGRKPIRETPKRRNEIVAVLRRCKTFTMPQDANGRGQPRPFHLCEARLIDSERNPTAQARVHEELETSAIAVAQILAARQGELDAAVVRVLRNPTLILPEDGALKRKRWG